MYPFMINIDRQVFAILYKVTEQGYEDSIIEFWYPRLSIGWLPKGTNFVTSEPSYPDMTAPWHQKPESDEDWDIIPF